MKNQKGITLIALVITIIVLAILAAVSITALTGNNGVITEALQTSEDSEIADEEEKVTVAYMSTAMKNHGYGTTVDELQKELDETVGAGKTEVTSENGKLNVKFKETGRTYVAGDIYTDDWDSILAAANRNPNAYKYPGQASEYIGIGTDTEPVNMDLWTVTLKSDKTYALGVKNANAYRSDSAYLGEITDGMIEGCVPQYIYNTSESSFMPVTEMFATFTNNKELKIAPKLPTTVTNIEYSFYYCSSLVQAPEIPDGVVDMGGTFSYCSSLKTAPIIPSSVKNLSIDTWGDGSDYIGTFYGCYALTGDLIINSATIDLCTKALYMAATNDDCSLQLSGNINVLYRIYDTKATESHISIKK